MTEAAAVVPPGRLDVPTLHRLVVRRLREGGPGSPGTPDVRVEYVANWGGFVNASFRLRDGARDLRWKLAYEPTAIEGLRRWERLATALHERHLAPRMERWMRLDGTAYEGPVFEWVEGATPAALDDRLVARMAVVLEGLGGDAELKRALGPSRPTCRDVYAATFGQRFREDLRLFDAEGPGFLAREVLDWARGEVEALERRVEGDPAFDAAAGVPTHGDLWLDNLLLGTDGRLVVLDWDDLGLGDPVLDWATLLGPSRADLRPPDPRRLPPPLAGSRAARSRFDLYGRAALLDWAVDGVADWIDARELGERSDEARTLKERSVRAALDAYRAAFR